jgi:hypothetical protein
MTYESGGWTHYLADLSEYAGSTVQIGFHFRSSPNGSNASAGWYIDEVKLYVDTSQINLQQVEAFNTKLETWYAHKGVWQVGQPNYAFGPSAAHSPTRCLGTVLGGAYPNNAHSRFISPAFFLGSDEVGVDPVLTFWHWYKITAGDYGQIQISLDEGPWQDLSAAFTGNKASWTKDSVSLAPYLGHVVRVAFEFQSDNLSTDAGWYLDDLQFKGICPSPNNIGIVEILSLGEVALDSVVTPQVVVVNFGDGEAVFTLSLEIGPFYAVDTVLALAGGILDTIAFAPFVASSSGTYVVTASVDWADDACAGNDELQNFLAVNSGQGPVITFISPNEGGNTGSTTVEIKGQFFQEGAGVWLTKGQNTIFAYNLEWIDEGRLFASFDLMGQNIGPYDLHLQNPDFVETVVYEGFDIVDGSIGWGGFASSSCAASNFEIGQLLQIDIVRPTAARPNRVVPMTVKYKNTGNIDIPLPARVLVSLSGAPISLTEPGLAEGKQELFLELKEAGGPPNVLRAGAGGSIKFYTKTPATNQVLQFKLME